MYVSERATGVWPVDTGSTPVIAIIICLICPCGVTASIAAFQAVDTGSIPVMGFGLAIHSHVILVNQLKYKVDWYQVIGYEVDMDTIWVQVMLY